MAAAAAAATAAAAAGLTFADFVKFGASELAARHATAFQGRSGCLHAPLALHATASAAASTGFSSAFSVTTGLGLGLAAVAGAAAVGRRARRGAAGGALAGRWSVAERGAILARQAGGGVIETFLVPGPVDVSKLATKCAPLAAHFDLTCLTFFSLGVPAETIAAVAGGSLGIHGVCPVYIADCYGIVGWDAAAGANVELMEKGRGSEFGCVGGNGGEGVVVVAFRGDGYAPSCGNDALPADRSLHMVVTANGSEQTQEAPGAAYGGLAKACWRLEHSGDLASVPRFAVSAPSAVVTSFTGDASEAAAAAVQALPEAASPALAAGYFPCFCRGVNKYGEDGVEPAAFAAVPGLADVRLFGMFAHGELGPPVGGPVLTSEGATKAELHSMTSILALYGR